MEVISYILKGFLVGLAVLVFLKHFEESKVIQQQNQKIIKTLSNLPCFDGIDQKWVSCKPFGAERKSNGK